PAAACPTPGSGRRIVSAQHRMLEEAADARFGSLGDLAARFGYVRFIPGSGHQAPVLGCPLSANRVTSHCGKNRYSITSSARATNCGGKARASVLAVLRLTTNSNLVGCSSGSSAALAPRRI